MPKRVQFDDEARRSLWRGIDQLASAVRITLGPRGRSVAFDRLHGVPALTRDGIAVAQEVELADPFENTGVRMLREAAFQTGQLAGDGTTTATVLAHRLVRDGLRAVAAGHHPLRLKRGIERGVADVVRALAAAARPIDDPRDLERIAIVAAGDRGLGELVAHALARVGRDGVVAIEEGRGLDVTLERVEGARVAGGYVSPYFITDAEDMECAFDHPLVVVVEGALERQADVSPALEHAARLARPLLWFCHRVAGDALALLVVNRLRGTAPTAAIAIPGPHRRAVLDDIAHLTGAQLVAPELGRACAAFDPAWFGRARHATATAEHTTLLQGGGRGEALAAHAAALRRALAAAAGEAECAAIASRLARFTGGVAVIRVGAPTEFERHARRSQLEDALAATRAALAEGVVPGGGVALVRVGVALAAEAPAPGGSAAEAAGRALVLAALAEPAWQIGVNAGEEGDAVVARVRAGEGGFGFNARSCRYGDLAADGVLDAAKVLRCALQSAASVAGLVLTTEAVVIEDEAPPAEPEAPAA